MKYWSIFLFIVFFAGCLKDTEIATEQNTPKLGDPFDVKIGETVSLNDGQLTFQFINVPEDSRCPIGAYCVWAGNAAVVIKISNAMDTLNTSVDPKEITAGSYKITLLTLSPYPKIGVVRDTAQYVARFVAGKL